ERAASDALAMDVRIEGPVRLSMLTGPRVALHDVRVRAGGHQLAAVESARLGLDLAALGARRAPGAAVALRGLDLRLVRDHRGFNFDVPRRPGAAAPAFALGRLRISNAALH